MVLRAVADGDQSKSGQLHANPYGIVQLFLALTQAGFVLYSPSELPGVLRMAGSSREKRRF
jgi:hypothetical protein